jgi:hypothetical protein
MGLSSSAGGGGDPASGATAPHSVIALVDVPPQHNGDDMAVELALYDDGNQLVQAPGPLGQKGTGIRFAQHVSMQQAVATLPGGVVVG